MESVLEITDAAIQKILQKQKEERFDYIRLGITGGGCAGFEYVFTTTDVQDSDDIVLEYGKFSLN